MKKIIWLFGQHGSGRKTLIRNILESNNDALKSLGFDNAKISIISLPYNRSISFIDYKDKIDRRESIINKVGDFVVSDSDIAIIIGEYPDYDVRNNGTLIKLNEEYPEIEKEIFMLNPSNIEIAYKRLRETEWFQSNSETNEYKYPIQWLFFATDYMRKRLLSFEEFGYTFYEIDTLDGYEIRNVSNKHTL